MVGRGGGAGDVPENTVVGGVSAPDSWFSHLALEVPGEGCSNEWMEAVSNEVYGKLG